MTAAGTDTFAWDYADRMTSSTVGGTTTAYAYDGEDTRKSKTTGGVTTNNLYDRESGLPLVVDDGTNAFLHSDGILAEFAGTTPEYLLDDGLGSVRGVSDLPGTLAGTANHNVFGGIRSTTGAGSTFGFTGEQRDSETGFTYLRARYLNPGISRFMSADTVQPNAPGTQGYNLYAYVANNPTTWVDPSGHSAAVATFAPGSAPPIVQIGARLLAVQMATGNFIQKLFGVCAAGRSGLCVTAVGTAVAMPIVICAFWPGCVQWALEQAGIISTYGSPGGGTTTWDGPSAREAVRTWPRIVPRPIPWLPTPCGVTPWILLDPASFAHIWDEHGPYGPPSKGRFKQRNPLLLWTQVSLSA